MPDLAEVDLYCAEAKSLVRSVEEILNGFNQNRACEGHRLMAEQGLAAIRRLERTIEGHRRILDFETCPNAIDFNVSKKRGWLSILRWHSSSEDVQATIEL